MKFSLIFGLLPPLLAAAGAIPPAIPVGAACLLVLVAPWPWSAPLALGLLALSGVLDGAVPRRQSAGPAKLRLVTWNADSKRARWPALIEFVREIDADVLCLQEFYYRLDPARLAALFPGWHFARPPPDTHSSYDTLTLSRYPFGEIEVLPLGRSWCLRTQVQTPDGPVWVANLRLRKAARIGPWIPVRRTVGKIRWQGEWLSDLLENHPVDVLAGDFNSPPLLRPSPAGLEDSYQARDSIFAATFPSHFPLWRIDYVLVSQRVGVLTHRVRSMLHSDHRAIVVELTW